MDFLDPRKRRSHAIRLMVGYGLMAAVIVMGAYLLVKAAEGYGINTKTGGIIQNGLLFVDSQPGGADIYLNDKPRGSKTSARLILPIGDYKLTLKKDGYRTWERKITLDGRSVARYVYPFLFPADPRVTTLKTYSSDPPLMTQSPDRRWLLLQEPQSSGGTVVFDEYDTTKLDQPASKLTVPAGFLTKSNLPGNKLSEVEWSTDNKHLLLLHRYQGGKEFVIFNRDSPAKSINVNKLLKTTPAQVGLRNKKIDQLYIFENGKLLVGDTKKSTMTPLLTNVLAFKSSGANLISYITTPKSPKDEVTARIWDGSKSYPLYTFKAGKNYLVDMAQFQGHWYYVAGSNSDERLNIYKDPLNGIKDPSFGKAIPLLSLNLKGVNKVSFSTNARFIAAEAGQFFSVYDMETQNAYQYKLKAPLSDMLHWMDGHRLIGASGGEVLAFDYDATNQQLLVPTNYPGGGFFDRNYEHMFTTVKTAKGIVLEDVDMRAGIDLPKASQ